MTVLQRVLSSRRALFALADVGPASAGSLAIGVLAVRDLAPAALGVYSMLYSCAFLVAVAATQTVFLPRERRVATGVLGRRSAERGAWRVTGRAVVASSLAGLVTVALIAYLYRQEPTTSTLVLGAGALLLGVTSPAQDYVRRLAHILDRGAVAVSVSVSQLVLLLVCCALLWSSRSGGPWLLVVLGAANGVSAAVGLVVLALRPVAAGGEPTEQDPSPEQQPRRGADRDRLAAGLLPDVSYSVGNLAMERFGGLALVGSAEAARLLAQPVLLAGMAASNVLARTALRAGAHGDPRAGRRASLLSAGSGAAAVLVVLGVCYLPPTTGLLRDYAPLAYEHGPLILLTCLAHLLVAVGAVMTLQLVGAHRERAYLGVEWLSGVVLVLVCTASGVLGAAGRPLAVASSGAARLVLGGAVLRRSHRQDLRG